MKKLNNINVILIISIIIVIIINIGLLIKINNKIRKNVISNGIESESNVYEKSEEEEKEDEILKLQKMTERDRMEYYFSKFIKLIKDEKYSEAYNLLYPEFKDNYFMTQEEFREYVKKTYPRSIGFSYNDIDRQGSIYVLIIKIIDPNKKVGEEKSQRIVIKENDFNDFVLSFQVI